MPVDQVLLSKIITEYDNIDNKMSAIFERISEYDDLDDDAKAISRKALRGIS